MNLTALSMLLTERLEDLLIELEIDDITTYPNRIAAPCPIHGSDSDESLNIYTDGHSTSGNWVCWTHNCHQEYGSGILNFIQGVLESRGEGEGFGAALYWAKNFIGEVPEIDANYVPKVDPKKEFVRMSDILTRKRNKVYDGISRDQIRNKLIIPAPYFLERGYTEQILDKYDVGYCPTKGKEMFGRCVVPVYSDDHKFMIGCVGRTVQPVCPKCNSHHYENRHCPENKIEKKWAQKWINSTGFSSGQTLYNYWYAQEHIEASNTIIIVEGQGDVWRLEESGIHIGVGSFSNKLTEQQMLMLETSGAINVILAFDNDNAGQIATEATVKKLSRFYNCEVVDLKNKDVGEMTIQETQDTFNPIIERLI